MGSGQSCSSACVGGEGTASPVVQGSAVSSEMRHGGRAQGYQRESLGQRMLLLEVVCGQQPCCAHSGPLRRISLPVEDAVVCGLSSSYSLETVGCPFVSENITLIEQGKYE